MNIFARIKQFFKDNYVPFTQEEIEAGAADIDPSPRRSFDPAVNPATGMPMVGQVDCMGSPFGQR